MEGLSIRERLMAWLSAMRRAGGLGFDRASDRVKREVLDLERSVPARDQQSFRTHRDSLLGANAVLCYLFQNYSHEAGMLLARAVALLSLTVVLKAEDTRELIAQAAETQSGTGGPARKRAATKGIDPSSLKDFARLWGVMFAQDTPAMRQYWAEVLGTAPDPEGATWQIDIGDLIRTKGDPLERVIAPHVQGALTFAMVPVRVHEQMIGRVPASYLVIEDFVLPPVSDHLSQHVAIARAINESALGHGLRPEEIEIIEPTVLQQMIEAPRNYVTPRAVINSYEEWLFARYEMCWSAPQNLRWRPELDAGVYCSRAEEEDEKVGDGECGEQDVGEG